MLIPLKITTDYSLLKSMIKVETLISYLKENHFTTAAICDDNLYGVMEFYTSCKKNNIKPIIGLTIKINQHKCYCYPINYNGYQNLLKLHTIMEQREVSIYDIKMYQQNLKIILPYENIEIYDDLKNVTSNLFVGYNSDCTKLNSLLVTDKTVYINEIKAFDKEDALYLDYLNMIREGTTIKNHQKSNYENNCFPTSELEIDDEQSTIDFAKDIEIIFPKNQRYIPKYDSKTEDSYDYLVALTKKGLQKRLQNHISSEYVERLKYELEVIKKMGFVDYFLIVYDYVFFAKKNGILVGPGRGSAAGSLVSYTLGITEIDPIKYNLLFERFLNIERVTMPDIDIDFEYTKRGQVIEYVKEKYGRDCVAGIMTFGTLGSKLVLRDIGKCLEYSPELINKFVNLIDAKKTLLENLENPAIKFYFENNQDINNLVKICLKLEGLKRHISTHAAGIVISSVPLDNVIPICYSAGEMLTGVTMSYLEDLGLLKMDFLALRNLSIIQNVIELIEKDNLKKINLNRINLNDPKVLEIFKTANTMGIFQFESAGMIHFLEKLKASSFDDLVASLALFRPGPMENIDSFIRRKEGREKVEYLHPDLEEILKETYGIIVYQEQIMQILSQIGGFTYSESDNIRRAMSKKKKEVILSSKEKFIKGATAKGYDNAISESIYNLILKFANYGFNKAHSVSYALIGYQMAYLKVYYPIYYIVNLLNMNLHVIEKTKEYLIEAKKLNYQIMPPDINLSEKDYLIKDHQIILPFLSIKSMGSESTEAIINERDKNGNYLDFFDFVGRTYGKSITKKTLESLIDAGCFYNMEKSYDTLKENIDSAINYATLISDLEDSLFKSSIPVMKPALRRAEDKKIDDRKREFEIFGFYLSNHPSSKYTGKEITKLDQIETKFDKFIKCVVIIENVRKIETKKKEPMAFLLASDETSSKDFVVFAKYFPLLNEIQKNDLVLIEGKVMKRFDKFQVNVSNIVKSKGS